MSEWRLFDNDIPEVSTRAFHEHRERAAHLEQPDHRVRLVKASRFVLAAQQIHKGPAAVSDLGCGDGGLLSLIQSHVTTAWGYDFCPANQVGWRERHVKAELLDVFGEDSEQVRFGDITCVTEVLEHLADPHGALKWIGANSQYIVASSPWDESSWQHDDCHAWAWDFVGYRALVELGGYRVLRHEPAGRFQVLLGMRL